MPHFDHFPRPGEIDHIGGVASINGTQWSDPGADGWSVVALIGEDTTTEVPACKLRWILGRQKPKPEKRQIT